MKSDLKSQIFVAVSAAITQKYPTQTTIDYTYIADTALKLTNTLYDKYNEDNKVKPELLNEQEAHINDQIRIPLAEEPNWT
jgi:hypothetical protein